MKVSLFPFLPVLLCMMGAMILLLILIVRDVREQTSNPAEAAVIPTMTLKEAEELERKIVWQSEDADFHAANLSHAKEQAEEGLADLQARLALAERETQKIKEELARLEQLAQQFDPQTEVTPEEVEQLKRLLVQQQQRRAEAELELAELRKEAAQKEKSYAIVPYRGPDGTFRRPIYIECHGDKIIIQPEGIELMPGDFQALDRPNNPFATALRVIRQYYIETEQIVRGSEPYPLLIVRPSGVEMFSNAWQTMQPRPDNPTGSWVKDFGYEIVCEDWNIQYPEPNEELRRRLQQQLASSRSQLGAYTMAQRTSGPQPGFSGTAPRFSVDHRGNVTPVGGGLRSSEDAQQHLAAYRDPSRAGGGSPPVGCENTNQLSPSEEQDTARSQETAERDEKVERQMQNSPPQRQQNWALQGATQFTTGISRTVRIHCEAERFVIPTQAGLTAEHEIPITGSVLPAVDQLVQAIWDFQSSWGSAGTNVHWRPILKVQVFPGGERRLQELQTLLRNSGLVIETF